MRSKARRRREVVEGTTGERSKARRRREVVEGNTGESCMFLVHVEQKSDGRELYG